MQTTDNQEDSAVENQITEFKQQLDQKSTQELSQVASQLENVEKVALKRKISNQLDSIQESLTQSGENQPPNDTQEQKTSGSSTQEQNSNNDKTQESTKNQKQDQDQDQGAEG